jgi:hypothetical protein
MGIEAYITIAILSVTFVLLIKTKIPPVAVFKEGGRNQVVAEQ